MSPQSREESAVAFESMFEHASIGIVISNLEGTIERANREANRIFGYGKDELVGQKVEILVPPHLRQRHIGHRTHYNEQPAARPMGLGMNLTGSKKDGTEFPVEISLAAYEVDGKKEIVSFIIDITQRKKDEERLKTLTEELEDKVEERTEALSQAIKELQQTNENLGSEMEQRKRAEEEARRAFEKEKELGELKSRFVSMASHEFRTPLSGILTSAALIERYIQGEITALPLKPPSELPGLDRSFRSTGQAKPDPVDAHSLSVGNREKIIKHVQTVKASVQSLANILNDFLSLDKLEAGKIESHPTSFVLSDLATDLAQEMESLAKKDQRILYEHRGGKDPVFLDKELLRNILINLLSNAVKYSSEATEIRFITETQRASVVVTVQDTGIGIPEAEQKHLFERFFRAGNALNVPGTGLGLNIIRKYLDLMGGTISFKSRENEGTTFIVTIPLTPL